MPNWCAHQARTLLILLSVIGGASFLAACSPGIAFEVFNNSGLPLTVIGCKEPISLEPGKLGRILSARQCSKHIRVDASGASWTYRVHLPSHNSGETEKYYYHSHSWWQFDASITVRLQINADHRVFALPEGSDFPEQGEIPQPNGFPWQPVILPAALPDNT